MRSVLLAVVVVAGCTGDAPSSRAVPTDQAPKLLIDRNWIDAWPEAHDDHLFVARFVPSMGGGVFQDRTVFQGQFELFVFHTHGDQLKVHLPHTGEHVDTKFRIERVDGPEPFDLKLTLDANPRGPRVYYSVEAQRGTTAAALDAQLPPMSPQR